MNQFKEKYRVEKGKPIVQSKTNVQLDKFYYLYDEQGNSKGKVNEEYEEMTGYFLRGASTILVTDKGAIAMQRRKNTKLNANQLDCCSGHVKGTETYEETAYREIEEEAKISAQRVSGLERIGEPVKLEFKERKFFIQFFMARISCIEECQTSEEVEEWFEADKEEFINYLMQEKTKFPYFGYEDAYCQLIKQIREIDKEVEWEI